MLLVAFSLTTDMLSLLYVKITTAKIDMALEDHNIDITFTAHTKILNILYSAETKINMENIGVYETLCRDCYLPYLS